MKPGLIAAGSVAKHCVAALQLGDTLGPVAAASQRVASRITNSLRAGYPVGSYADAAAAYPLILCVPAQALPDLVAELVRCGADWRGTAVLAYKTDLDTSELTPLREAGASAACMRLLNTEPPRYILNGDREAMRAARALVRRVRGRVIELEPGGSALFNAGLSFATAFWTPLLAVAAACLRGAGAAPAEALHLAPMLAEDALRAHFRGGRKSWMGALAGGEEKEVLRQLEALEAFDAGAARYFRDCAGFSLGWLRRHPVLAQKLARRAHT